MNKSTWLDRESPQQCAVVCKRGLGDALLFMIITQNLVKVGIPVTTFSTILSELREWFPSFSILPFPASENVYATLAPFNSVIAIDHVLAFEEHSLYRHLMALKESDFDKSKTMVDNLCLLCSEKLSLPSVDKGNGIVPPAGLTWRKHPRRVILHPFSTEHKRNWPASKFISLAEELEKQGSAPFFCMSPAEAEDWKNKVPPEKLPLFSHLGDTAAFIYESGYLIGNNSGLGHLASALNIPTLSLFARKSYANLWHPGWGYGRVICPPPVLPGARLKQKYWKQLICVLGVKKAFMKMQKEFLPTRIS